MSRRQKMMNAAQAFGHGSGIARFVDLINKSSVNGNTSVASITPNCDDNDIVKISALAVNLGIEAPSGTPSDGQRLSFWIKDAGVSKTLTWNAIYRGGTITLPASTTINRWRKVNYRFNEDDTKWDAENSFENF